MTAHAVIASGLHGPFESQAALRPDAIALVCGDLHVSFAMLEQRTNRIAHALRRAGAGPETRVGLCVTRSDAVAVGRLAVLKAGAAYVPVDPDDPVDRIASLLDRARVVVVLTEPHAMPRLAAYAGPCLDLRDDFTTLTPASPASHASPTSPTSSTSDRPPSVGLTSRHLAYILFTSGSTGAPKGVLMPHESVVSFSLAVADRLALSSDDRVLQFAAVSFDVVEEEIWPVWARGGTVVTFPQRTLGLNELGELLVREQITVLELPTAYWHTWTADLCDRADVAASLRHVLIGGERASASALARWRAWGLPLANVYGLTETAVTSMMHRDTGEGELLLGEAIADARVYVCDAHMAPVVADEAADDWGELLIGGVGLARGYLDQPMLTASRFVPDPFGGEPGARLYRTGDRVRRLADDGLEFLGRADEQVKVRGFRVELGEVETILLRHPGVTGAAAALREIVPGERVLVAFVTGGVDVDALRSFVAQHAPDYMVPARIVVLDDLPKNANGKIDRRALATIAPTTVAPAGSAANASSSTPHTAVERTLSMAWGALLRRGPRRPAAPAPGMSSPSTERTRS